MERNCSKAQQLSDKRINEIVTSLEFTQAKLDDALSNLKQTESERKELTTRIQSLTQENQELHKQLNDREARLDYLDDQSRRNNLRFSGVPEESGENWEHCQKKVMNIVKEQLKIEPVNLERVHRVGKVKTSQPRDIIARFSRFPERESVYRSRTKLRGTNIFINEDFCPGTMEVRRNQTEELKQARRDGKQAFFNYRTLVVREPYRGHGGRREDRAEDQRPPSTPSTPPRTSLQLTPLTPTLTVTSAACVPGATTVTTPATTSTTWVEVARTTPARSGVEGEGAAALPAHRTESTAEKRQLRGRTQATQHKK